MNYIGEGLPPKFLHDIRRVENTTDFWRVCGEFLEHDERMALEPEAGVSLQPN